MSGSQAPSAVAESSPGPSSLETIRCKLWQALRVMHEQRTNPGAADDGEKGKPQSGQLVDRPSSDVHIAPTVPESPLELTRADMEQLISCVYCAVHTNATEEDSQTAAASVLQQIDSALPGSRATVEASYTQDDVALFLDSVPSRWLPDLVAAQEEATQHGNGASLWEDFNVELIECIVDDEAPNILLLPSQVLTLQRSTAAVELSAPLTDYLTLNPTRAYPPVYDTLFEKLYSLDERSTVGLSLEQFRLFFRWFYVMHFRNTNLPRSNAVADNLYRRYQDARGNMTVAQFRLVCEEICAVYAQRRDADTYLQLLIKRTEDVLLADIARTQDEQEGTRSDSATAEFFLHPEKVTIPSWQRDLVDPTQLYLPDELRVVQQEAERHHRHTSPRILLAGPVGIGKSAVGHQLAEELHCVHLDVLQLALEVVQRKRQSSVSDVIAVCMENQTPLHMDTQVTLLREAMLSERAQYRGYVFSDTITSTTDAIDQVEEHFARPLRIWDDARPDHVVELVCAVPEVYAEYATTRAEVAASACNSAWAMVAARAEDLRQAAEKQQKKADCEKVLAHLLELEEAWTKKEVSLEELEVAREQAAEAQEILDAMNAEPLATENASENAEVSPEMRIQLKNEELQLCLAALIYEGRKAAAVLAVTSASGANSTVEPNAEPSHADTIAPLSTQDWTSCWRKTIESARNLGRHITVDPIASGDSAHVVSYVTHALNLKPCDLAEALDIQGEESADDTTTSTAIAGAVAEGDAARARPTSLEEDEEHGRMIEDMVAERGLRPSPVWKNYCPVTALVDGVLIEGAACYACAYRGCYYYFASLAKRNAFVDYPTRYLREAFPEQKAVLLLADDTIIDTLPEMLQQVADEIAIQCRLTPFSATAYAKLLEPRQKLLQLRAAAQEARRRTEAATRKARHERQEILIKAQSKKSKNKLEPRKPKTKRVSDSTGRNLSLSSQPQQHATGPGGRRRMPRAMVVDGPQNMATQKQVLIDAAKEKKAKGAPLLVTAISTPDLDYNLFQMLLRQQLVPETVVALRFAKTAADGNVSRSSENGEEEDDEYVVGEEHEYDGDNNNNADESANMTGELRDNSVAASSTSAFQRILQLLRKGVKSDWRTAKAEVSDGATAAPSYSIHTIPFGESENVAETVAEMMHLLNPLSIVAIEDAVDETLGEEDGNDEDEEQAAEDEALLYPEGTEHAPPLPCAPRDPLVKPMRRFLHQFGSRLDYCPVTLHDRGILMRGKQELCLRYEDGLHIFVNEEARDAFARCPQRYVGELPPQDLPPRVWIVGVARSGKKTLAAGLHEAYRVPFFEYDRQFFEECVEAALMPGGSMVRGVYILADTKEVNPYLKRAHTILESVRDKEKEEKKHLEEKAEAERQIAEHERKLEEREAREEAGYDDEEEEYDSDNWTEEKEAALQEKIDFEPEDEEEKQLRLSEAYLRIASCVTRFRPFDKLGYVMICPPFSDGDLDVLFDEGCIPEVVVRLIVDEDVFNERKTVMAAAQRAATQRAKALDIAAKEREVAQQATQKSRDAARQQRAREKALAKWRRRHIGADDVDVPSDAESEVNEGINASKTNGADDSDEPNSRNQNGNRLAGEEEEDRQTQEDALEELVAVVEERRVEVVKINAAAAKETVRRAAVCALGRHLAHRASLFYHPEVIHPEEMAARLASGRCDWSSFGSQDPVRLYDYRREGQCTVCKWKPPGVRVGPEVDDDEKGAVLSDHVESGEDEQPLEEPEELSEVASEDLEELREAVRRRDERARREASRRVARVNGRIYLFDDDTTLARFMRNPWPFLREPPPTPTLPQATVVALFEPDTRCETEVFGSKQRCLADSVAYNLRSKCVSTSSLLAWGAVHTHWQSLRFECMLAAQQSVVDVSLTQKLLTLYLSSAEAKKDGVVLHNLPVTSVSANALTRVNCTPPIVKVLSALSEESAAASSLPQAIAAQTVQSMRVYASVDLILPHPSAPLDSSNLVAAVHGVEAFRAAAQDARLRESRGFPISLRDSYEVFCHVQRHLSEFGDFCPYEWIEKGDLVRCFPKDLPTSTPVDLRLGAKFLGQYFFFSSADYLHRFLLDPTAVTDLATAKPIPKHLPMPVPVDIASHLQEADLALEGCCPVLLYDTRDRLGMRGVRQPIAKKGSLDFVVDYKGQKYAMRNGEHQRRFLRRPWQYTDGAQLPAVLRRPLLNGMKPSAIVDTEEYLQRQLYDPVAQALLAVGRERPLYPGLSPEESALKYVSLHLKAHRDPDNISAFEAESYKTNFEVFHTRATLYRQVMPKELNGKMVNTSATTAVVGAANVVSADHEDASTALCSFYEEVQADAGQMGKFNRLLNPSDSVWNRNTV